MTFSRNGPGRQTIFSKVLILNDTSLIFHQIGIVFQSNVHAEKIMKK